VSELRPPTGLLFIFQVIYEYGEPRWNDINRVKPKNSEKICPSATLFTTNATWTELGANPGLHYERPATNCMSHGTLGVFTSVHVGLLVDKVRLRQVILRLLSLLIVIPPVLPTIIIYERLVIMGQFDYLTYFVT
jgi:hypothetical protein